MCIFFFSYLLQTIYIYIIRRYANIEAIENNAYQIAKKKKTKYLFFSHLFRENKNRKRIFFFFRGPTMDIPATNAPHGDCLRRMQ